MRAKSWMYGFAGLLLVGATSGCSLSDMESVESTKTNVLRRYTNTYNGVFTNGRYVNGRFVNGRFVNGRFVNGRFVNGTVVQGNEEEDHPILEYVEIDTGVVGNGSALVNMELDGYMSDGSIGRLKVLAYDSTTVPGMELYRVIYLDGPDAGQSVCGSKDGEQIWATMLPQRFNTDSGAEISADPNQYTFSCRFGGIQKCQEYGYPKNQKRYEDFGGNSRRRRLTDYHAACVRLVRADYCGDGIAHTFDGTSIDIYDHLRGGNTPSSSPTNADSLGYYFEAEWEKDGAHCISKTRWMNNGLSGLSGNRSLANDDYKYIRDNCPERFAFSVQLADTSWSTPDRACGTSSKWESNVGYGLYSDDSSEQNSRGKIRNHSMLNIHVP